jgi:hypothetical protein
MIQTKDFGKNQGKRISPRNSGKRSPSAGPKKNGGSEEPPFLIWYEPQRL